MLTFAPGERLSAPKMNQLARMAAGTKSGFGGLTSLDSYPGKAVLAGPHTVAVYQMAMVSSERKNLQLDAGLDVATIIVPTTANGEYWLIIDDTSVNCTLSVTASEPTWDGHRIALAGIVCGADGAVAEIEQLWSGGDFYALGGEGDAEEDPTPTNSSIDRDSEGRYRIFGSHATPAGSETGDGWRVPIMRRTSGGTGVIEWVPADSNQTSPVDWSLECKLGTGSDSYLQLFHFDLATDASDMEDTELLLFKNSENELDYISLQSLARALNDHWQDSADSLDSDGSKPWWPDIIRDHGMLDGLLDDDHTQYWINTGAMDYTRNYGATIGDSSGSNMVISLDAYQLVATDDYPSVDWSARELLYASVAVLKWGAGELWDNGIGSGGRLSLDWEDRQLVQADTEVVLDWEALELIGGWSVPSGSSLDFETGSVLKSEGHDGASHATTIRLLDTSGGTVDVVLRGGVLCED